LEFLDKKGQSKVSCRSLGLSFIAMQSADQPRGKQVKGAAEMLSAAKARVAFKPNPVCTPASSGIQPEHIPSTKKHRLYKSKS
jgi:hypothetical protein